VRRVLNLLRAEGERVAASHRIVGIR